jgi:hypothetical protein
MERGVQSGPSSLGRDEQRVLHFEKATRRREAQAMAGVFGVCFVRVVNTVLLLLAK